MILVQEGSRMIKSSKIRRDSTRQVTLPNEGPDPFETPEERKARVSYLRRKYTQEMRRRKPGKHGLL